MRIGYAFKEAISGFKKSRLSSFASTFTIGVAILILSMFAVGTYNINRLIEAIRGRVEIEVFLKDELTSGQVDSLSKIILSIPGVSHIKFISKDEAAKIFEREFGENIFSILDFNPLPASFKVSLKPAYRTSSRVESIARRIRKLEGVDDVKYRKLFLRILDRRYKIILRIMLAAGVVLSFLSILLVINTIRLTIYAKRKIIKTMQLVGATRGFIIFPFVIQGFIQGLIAGLISGGLSYILIEVLSRRIPDNILSQIDMPDWFYGAVVGFSSLLGLIGSWISARKFITYKIMN